MVAATVVQSNTLLSDTVCVLCVGEKGGRRYQRGLNGCVCLWGGGGGGCYPVITYLSTRVKSKLRAMMRDTFN